MATMTVTTRGQVTFRKEVLQHLGIKPGDKIELDLLPDGRGILQAAKPAGNIAGFVGLLAGRTDKIATIEEINETSEPRQVKHEDRGCAALDFGLGNRANLNRLQINFIRFNQFGNDRNERLKRVRLSAS